MSSDRVRMVEIVAIAFVISFVIGLVAILTWDYQKALESADRDKSAIKYGLEWDSKKRVYIPQSNKVTLPDKENNGNS